ncbi:unnamed protein product [Parnassius mnemosyne]|uniref:Mpv17-like protein 2 n=1 Tax=Parnassius mnemosyne TaxID=213953 RepID=A0AAV1KSP1_9NEOP
MVYKRLISRAYNTIQIAFGGRNLIYTNVLLSMTISTVGDVLEQSYEIFKKDLQTYDFRRTSQMALSGSTSGIICHHWYNFLDKIIIGRSIHNVIKKLLLDQFICSPLIIVSFFATVAIFEKNPLENFTGEVQEKFWSLYKAEWVIWPPAQIINFYFLPTKYRVLYDSTISLGYDVYTSHVKHRKSSEI